MPKAFEQTRVVKRLATTQPGAIKLARRYGDALVCVRYRHDADGRHRYTTVELVVEKAPIVHRPNPIVAVQLATHETALHDKAFMLGAQWNGKIRLWFMTRNTAKKLGVLDCIVQN